ncbi:MAG: CinA family protein [Devosia sp.]
MPPDIAALAAETVATLRTRKLTVATAESCTGGLIAGALTSIPGSSDVVYGGFVTYANAAKILMVGVSPELLREYGAVSEPVARAMAEGARLMGGVDIAVAVTGIAGPDGGSVAKPVGLVHFAVATLEETMHLRKNFDPGWSRDQIRHASVVEALRLVGTAL